LTAPTALYGISAWLSRIWLAGDLSPNHGGLRGEDRWCVGEGSASPRRLTFDAERAPELLGELFAQVEVERWDAPLVELPTTAAVRDYLIGKGVERGRAAACARTVQVPLQVTKRGALVFGVKP
jgi:hypothetical protein